jgi:hypothetical protein
LCRADLVALERDEERKKGASRTWLNLVTPLFTT